jgi:hypothetical protein
MAAPTRDDQMESSAEDTIDLAATNGPPKDAGPTTNLNDMHDWAFLKHVRQLFPDGSVVPDDVDMAPLTPKLVGQEAAEEYRLWQANKLMRIYREWKLGQN